MNTNSNSYTIIYASIMVVIVAIPVGIRVFFSERKTVPECRTGHKETNSGSFERL